MTYRTLTPEDIRTYLAQRPHLAERLGGAPASWNIREVSDGNLNAVHLVAGHSGGVCFKQALPHVRVDPSWKMPLERAVFEARYMRETEPYAGHLQPALLHDDPELFLLVVESLSDHVVLRSGLLEGTVAPGFSSVIGEYVARTAYYGSSLAAPFEHMARRLERFAGNVALTRITVDLVLTDPFGGSSRNRLDDPRLEAHATALQADREIRHIAGHLQARFLTAPQTLLHGDLHTGSIMLRRIGNALPDIRVIDGEFAHCGPIGFDCGLYLGNLALHAIANPSAADAMQREATLFATTMSRIFRELWQASPHQGDIHSLVSSEDHASLIDTTLSGIWQDAAGFMGAEIIRRTIGFAHVADWELCENAETRFKAQSRALEIGSMLMRASNRIDRPSNPWTIVGV